MNSESSNIRTSIDLNCDMGEGIGNDEAIMPFISSANISCSYHAGDENTIRETMELAAHYKVSVGAHPSFADKKNFGREEMNLSPGEIHELITQQLILFDAIAIPAGISVKHVKPHGALYNKSAKDANTAKAIASAIRDFDPKLMLFGLSGSHSITEAKAIGLKTVSEVFADRTYQDDGSLTPRSQAGALIDTTENAISQALQMVTQKTVTSLSGKLIPIVAETICIHGDGSHAIEFAREIHDAVIKNGISINFFEGK